MKLFNTFLKDESGAVTVDWVVLTAAIVGLGIAMIIIQGPKMLDTEFRGGTAITVQLKDQSGTVIATQVTSNGGQYLFDNLSAGTYSVAVVKPVIGDTVIFVNPDGSTEMVTPRASLL